MFTEWLINERLIKYYKYLGPARAYDTPPPPTLGSKTLFKSIKNYINCVCITVNIYLQYKSHLYIICTKIKYTVFHVKLWFILNETKNNKQTSRKKVTWSIRWNVPSFLYFMFSWSRHFIVADNWLGKLAKHYSCVAIKSKELVWVSATSMQWGLKVRTLEGSVSWNL